MAGNRHDRRAAAVAGARKAGPAAGPTLDHALALEQAGRLREAFDAFLALVRGAGASAEARAQFGRFLTGNLPAAAHPDVDLALRAAVTEPWLRPEALAQPIARYLDAKHPGVAALTLPEDAATFLRLPGVAGLLGDPLLLDLLGATTAATPALERFLARARHAALRSDGPLDAIGPFLVALAVRAVASDFALTLPADEADALAREPALVAALRERRGVAELALRGTFELLDAAAFGDAPDMRLAEVHAAHIAQPAEEAALAAALVALTPIATETDVVRDQYEAFPYPRWSREPAGAPPLPTSVAKLLKRQRPAPRRVLVAGCGTGQHALLAARRWPRSPVLAVDVSRRSLGYAVRKAREADAANLTIGLADLLHAEALPGPFDVIESVGVLHHLADPLAGLRALVAALAPGGLLLIGLYARAARRNLDAARALAGEAWPRDGDALRAFRARALVELDRPEILYSPDFYSLGGVRDLIFHERERGYDLPEITTLLADAGLRLVAIEPPVVAPVPMPGETDVEGWDAAERANPGLFGGMIQLWATRTTG